MKALLRITVSFALVAVVASLSCGGDDDDDESVCDSRPSDYWENCERQCSDETDACRADCGPDPTGEPEGACEEVGLGGEYEPRDPAYEEYCDCYDACSWLRCVNDCYAPCGELVV